MFDDFANLFFSNQFCLKINSEIQPILMMLPKQDLFVHKEPQIQRLLMNYWVKKLLKLYLIFYQVLILEFLCLKNFLLVSLKICWKSIWRKKLDMICWMNWLMFKMWNLLKIVYIWQFPHHKYLRLVLYFQTLHLLKVQKYCMKSFSVKIFYCRK